MSHPARTAPPADDVAREFGAGRSDTTSRRQWRGRWLVVAGAVCVAVTAVAFVAGTRVRSPWHDALTNSQADVVATAPVEQRDFPAPQIEAQGKVSMGDVRAVPAPNSSGALIVTADAAKPGDVIGPGTGLAEISGRPLIALGLPFDLYRDIVPGDSGSDVRALQDALRAIGLYTGESDGDYGPATAAAVRALYRSVGAQPPSPSADAQAALATAQSALSAATLQAMPPSAPGDAAQTSPDQQSPGASPVDVSALEAAVADARRAADTPLPMGEILSLPSGPATVLSVAGVGARLGGDQSTVASLRSGAPSATVRVAVADESAFKVGAAVQVVAADDQSAVRDARVAAVSAFKQADETATIPGYDVTLTFADPSKLPFDDGAAVIARIPSSTKAQSGLAVPLVAIRQDASGDYVVVDGPSRAHKAVKLIRSGDGYALVQGDLVVGERVVVGASS